MQHSHHDFQTEGQGAASCCHHGKLGRPDYLLWGSIVGILLPLTVALLWQNAWLATYNDSALEFLGEMWWGIAFGVVTVGALGLVPRGVVESLLTTKDGKKSIPRALAAGVLLDMCNHGIILIGMKLYERGASLGQTFAFLIASPWNSFSLTLILISLIGLKWTLLFILFSLLIGYVSGHLIDHFVARGVLPQHPHHDAQALNKDFRTEWRAFASQTKWADWNPLKLFVSGLKDSKMIIRWMLLGVVVASLIRTFVPEDFFREWLGPSLAGLALTLVFATIIEVCSEGSVPIAADILTRAGAIGNGFTFLMAGASTDYTEIVALKETTGSWKPGLFLPLVTLPQILFIAYLLNRFAS